MTIGGPSRAARPPRPGGAGRALDEHSARRTSSSRRRRSTCASASSTTPTTTSIASSTSTSRGCSGCAARSGGDGGRRGSMIGFSSIRSQTTEPGQGAYAATKAATVMLFKTLAAELGPAGVRQHDRPRRRRDAADAADPGRPAWYQAYADKSILRRWAQPTRWSAPPSSSPPTPRATSPARRCSSTAAGPPPTAATTHRLMGSECLPAPGVSRGRRR